ncbi:EAL domain-containing protein (plasmid) [Bradyrhizobium sp. ISRA443]|uniref:EAL domain-containing protein n=1 Tax=unclassified Bradyrhizobium TaxID=2631580 RepID=UPI00247983D5|nr:MULTISPECIES: EAL domain-containing protein [unclassified Bradyrhizobium]WGR90819.1 EAL domain-containing protein [Bradyrhizobium sp. ISRA435]WGS03049.1 EAL domain-containing protein [Bradyrhizobium sp. ISRA436]WGS09917.1 EAL domain-containing protein [Bradyrhizobium sp. ISRA437]WGS16802.1 EAL domain-containing protein [Bradyrhizobium sp. ISRA443]
MSGALASDVQGQTILIVDDSPAMLRVAAEHLERNGFNVTVAGDGEEALARAELVRPDLVLLDVMMPRIDGFETCHRLQAIDGLVDVPVIFMTGLSDSDNTVRAFAAGGVDYVTKPFQSEELLARVRTHLTLRATQQQAKQAEREARQAHARLLDALEVIPEGLAVFDADDRYVLWNKRYAQLYAASCDKIAKGMKFEETLRAGLARGQFPDAIGHEAEWLADRLARHAKPHCEHEQRLPGDRWLRIEERRTADGGSVGVRIDITDLKLREESFRLLFEGNPIPMWVYDRESLKIVAVNNAAVDHYGYSREKFVSMSILDIRPREDRDDVVAAVATNESGSVRDDRCWRHLKADGTLIDVSIYSRKLRYAGREAALIAAIDITERKRAEQELSDTREFLDMVIENAPTPIIVKDAQNFKYVLLNRAAERLLGVPRTRYIGKTAFEVYPREEAETIFGYDRAIVKSRRQLCFDEHWLDTPGNGRRHVKPSTFPVLNAAGEPQYLLTVIEDVTERKEAQARIQHMSLHDQLTDLPNQTAFNEYLASAFEAAKSSGKELAVLCLDLDRFKEVNDIFGRSLGDALLCRAAERFSAVAAGAFLARLGSDDFVVILADCPQPSGVMTLVDRLLAASSEEFEIDGHRTYIGLNIGVAIYPADGTDPETLVANADAALCRAKADGRGMVRFFDADLDVRLREKRALHQDLNAAVSEGQLVLHYQPQAKIGGAVIGFEALLRWQHPIRGFVSPGVFVPLAEESGAILAIGAWVLREACREAASWTQPMRIAVNLSPAQFVQEDLPALVHTTLLETGLAADRLELEITEGVLIGDFDRAIAILRRLKALGVHIAMDDFGTGYSSLSYLQSFPFDKIKIDQSFISNVERNGQSAAIVRAVIGLGRGLNLPVVAEGVETSEQLDFLSREACDQVQGYLIGRPRPITDYLETIGRRAQVERPAAASR